MGSLIETKKKPLQGSPTGGSPDQRATLNDTSVD